MRNRYMFENTKESKEEWIDLGEVGVDSGQLMICDPCYIDDMWEDMPYQDLRVFKSKTGKLFAYNTTEARNFLMGTKANYEMFDNFESMLSTGRTPNQHIADKEWDRFEVVDNSFSYNGVSHKGGKNFKQINYPLGFTGLAVAFQSGYGDGCYKVKGRLKDGRIMEVRIIMENE